MSAILLPEVILYNTLDSIVKLLRDDLEKASADKDTILYKLLGVDEEGKPLKMNLYYFFKQAKKVFLTPDNLNVTFGYNLETAKQLSLAILLPGENAMSDIGGNEGYLDQITSASSGATESIQQQFTTMYDTTYQVLITGYNSSEVNIVYNVLKSMLLMVQEHLELMGLRIPVLSGQDIAVQQDIEPIPVFHKSLNISFKYELTVSKLLKDEVMKGFWYQMRICDPFDKTRCIPVKPRSEQV